MIDPPFHLSCYCAPQMSHLPIFMDLHLMSKAIPLSLYLIFQLNHHIVRNTYEAKGDDTPNERMFQKPPPFDRFD